MDRLVTSRASTGSGRLQYTVKRNRVTGAATDTAVWTPTSGNRIYVYKIEFTVSAAATVTFSEGADGSTTRLLDGDFAANGGAIMDFPLDGPYALATDAILKVTNSAGNVKSVVYGFEGI